MLRLIAVVGSIGLADSLNPSTIFPALYLASGQHARRDVLRFTAGVFAVYLVGGLVIAFGPGQLLLSIVPRPGRTVSYSLELAAGLAMLTAWAYLWSRRERLAQRKVRTPRRVGRSSALLGATIMVVELPTAFPYFAAIAAIVAADLNPVKQILLIVLFNVCFVLPLLLVFTLLELAGPKAKDLLARWRARLESRWPLVLAVVALLAGLFVTFLGATGLASLGHGHVGSFFRRFRRRVLHP
jgi:cytochrome c biogenesis protein CcdA